MKKTLLTIIATLFLAVSPSISFAADKIDVLQHTRAGGLGDRMVTYIADALGDQFGERIVVDNCAAAVQYLKKAKNPEEMNQTAVTATAAAGAVAVAMTRLTSATSATKRGSAAR